MIKPHSSQGRREFALFLLLEAEVLLLICYSSACNESLVWLDRVNKPALIVKSTSEMRVMGALVVVPVLVSAIDEDMGTVV